MTEKYIEQKFERRKFKMRLLEKDLERKLVNKIKELGGRAYKWVSPR